jgi:hypothetical protein
METVSPAAAFSTAWRRVSLAPSSASLVTIQVVALAGLEKPGTPKKTRKVKAHKNRQRGMFRVYEVVFSLLFFSHVLCMEIIPSRFSVPRFAMLRILPMSSPVFAPRKIRVKRSGGESKGCLRT